MAEPIPAASREAGADLEIVRDAPVEVHRQDFSRDQVELIKRTICAGATDDELALFIKVAERTGLDPFARQIHAVKRWDSDKGNVMSIQVGIDGFRLIAERTHRYAGRLGPYWCGEDGEWGMDDKGRPKPWLRIEPPSAAMVGVRHKDYTDPLYAIATWKSYVQTKKGGAVTHMWATKGDLMLAKCLPYRAKIETDRGSLPIGRIVRERLPVKVRSINLETGTESWQPVVNWWRNGSTNTWIRLWVPNGTHGNRCLRLTEDHPVWTRRGWTKAGELTVGDRVAVTSPTLTAEQRQVVLGGLLGDGSLAGRKTGANLPHYAESHSMAPADYLRWKAGALANLVPSLRECEQTDGAGGRHPTLILRTRSVPALLEFRNLAPIETLAELGDLGLAVWIMDDGGIKATGGKSGGVSLDIHCCGFGAEFAVAAARWFTSRYGVTPTVLRAHRNPYLSFGAEDARVLLRRLSGYLVAEGTRKRWVASAIEPGPIASFVFVPVQRIERRQGGRTEGRYDIEVAGTHTFVYNNVVVSNCAEALALRGAFPAELSGLYTDDEMGQSTNATPDAPPAEPTPAKAEGWADAAAEAAAHKAVADAIKTLYEDIPADHPIRAQIKAYRAEHGWPMSAVNLKALMVTVAKATNPSEPQEAPETPKPAKSRAKAPTPAPEAPSAPAAAPEGEMPWDGLPDPDPTPAEFVCSWCEEAVTPLQPAVVTGGAGGKSVEKWHKDCFAEKEAEVAGEDDPGRPFTE